MRRDKKTKFVGQFGIQKMVTIKELIKAITWLAIHSTAGNLLTKQKDNDAEKNYSFSHKSCNI